MTQPFTRSSVFACALALMLCLSVSIFSAQQAGPASQTAPASKQAVTVEDHGQKSRGASTSDPNVTTPRGANDAAKPVPAPAAKGGPTTRGGSCTVIVDSYTPWLIELYLEGGYWAEVPRYGKIEVSATEGRVRLYARARFTDGSVTTWGPRYFDCVGQTYTWKLYD